MFRFEKHVMTFRILNIRILIAFLLSSSVHSETITVVSDYWCPYNCEPNSELEGFGIDLLRLAFKKRGIEVEYTLKSWDQAVADVESNRYHGLMSAYKSESNLLIYPEMHFSHTTSCFYKKDNDWVFDDFSSLNDIRLGVIKGYSYGAFLDSYLAEHRQDVHWVSGKNPLQRLLNKMRNDEIDVIIEDTNVLEYQLSLQESPEPLITDYCLPVTNLYMAFAPGHPDTKRYIGIYQNQLNELLKDGTYQKVMSKYQSFKAN